MRSLYPDVRVADLCRVFGLSRQSYYRFIKRTIETKKQDIQVIEMVKSIRAVHPRIGVRKIYSILGSEFSRQGMKIGRDKLFDLLSDNQMLIRKRKRRVTTTNSYHHFHKYKNLIKDFVPYRSNQLWVSDITYVKVEEGFSYLFLITDAYSRKIVGYKLSKSLETKNALESLQMALEMASDIKGLIHHSDRGIQYCSHNYVKLCQDYGLRISMTEDGNPLDNSIAERVNGILKDEYVHELDLVKHDQMVDQIDTIIYKYNQLRPHLSCDMKTPNQSHDLSGPLKRRWRNYYTVNEQKQNKIIQ